LVERFVRIEEVRSSNLLSSTVLRGFWIPEIVDVVVGDGALVFGLGIARQLGWLTAAADALEPASPATRRVVSPGSSGVGRA
jgi:hypothetical protein